MDTPRRPLSNAPDAIRQRRRTAKRQLERQAQELSTGIKRRGPGRPRKDGSPAQPVTMQTPPLVFGQGSQAAPVAIPLHTTHPIAAAGAERFAAIPTRVASTGTPIPIVPDPVPPPVDPNAPPNPATTITPDEAKLFGKALRQYFEFGTAILLAKHPEVTQGLIGISGGNPAEFQKNFTFAASFVEGAAERVALKYNLRIPYMDEVIVAGAIGIATFGLVGKPSKGAQEAMKQAQEAQRAQQARNANPGTPNSSASAPKSAPNGQSGPTSSAQPAQHVESINTEAAGGMELD